MDWDAADAAPTSKIQQLQDRTKADDAVWQNFNMPCDIQDLRKLPQRYVRTGTLAANLDIKTYDVGNMTFGTQGSTGTIGELWVEYDVELITPQPSPLPLSAKIVSTTSISNAAIFGSAAVITGSLPVTASASTLTFNSPGQYLVEFFLTGTLSAYTLTTGTAATTALVGVSSGAAIAISQAVNVTAAGQTLILSSPTGTVTAGVTRVAQYQYSLA